MTALNVLNRLKCHVLSLLSSTGVQILLLFTQKTSIITFDKRGQRVFEYKELFGEKHIYKNNFISYKNLEKDLKLEKNVKLEKKIKRHRNRA